MQPFPEMAEILPECAQGRASVCHTTVDDAVGRTVSYVYGEFKDPSPAGTYVTLRLIDDTGKSRIMMTDFLYERLTCVEVVERAHGDMLIAGLGLGMILHPILSNPEVNSLTVIEKYPDVIDLISPTLPRDPRLRVITDDIFTWSPPSNARYDLIWFDIWPDIEAHRLREMRQLHNRFRPYLNRANANCWMESWHRRETGEGRRREKLQQMKSQAMSAPVPAA
jgi:hypothetical protein